MPDRYSDRISQPGFDCLAEPDFVAQQPGEWETLHQPPGDDRLMRPGLDRRRRDTNRAAVGQSGTVAQQREAKPFEGRQRGSLVKLDGALRLLAAAERYEFCKLNEALLHRFGKRHDPHCRVLVSPKECEAVLGIGDPGGRIVATPRAVHVDVFGVEVQRGARFVKRAA